MSMTESGEESWWYFQKKNLTRFNHEIYLEKEKIQWEKSDRDQGIIKMMSKYYAHGLPQQADWSRRWWSESKISKIKILDGVVPGNDKLQGATMGQSAVTNHKTFGLALTACSSLFWLLVFDERKSNSCWARTKKLSLVLRSCDALQFLY